MIIAKEGLFLIGIGLAVTVVLLLAAVRWNSLVLVSLSGLFALLSVFTTFFFRDPPRNITALPGQLVAPADGRILAVDTLDYHDYIGGPAIKISIFLSVFDVHINRVPIAGEVDSIGFHRGTFAVAYSDDASRDNQHSVTCLVTAEGERVLVKQITGAIARRIINHLQPGQKVTTGERFGMIRFGSRTELFVGDQAQVMVKAGDRVKGGLTILGQLSEVSDDEKQKSSLGQDRQL